MKTTRRSMLMSASCGFGYLAMQTLCQRAAVAAPEAGRPGPTAPLARAKRVIFLCMSGGPAQLDTFDFK
ncbi:MAG TPA: DUF1501 domain-containing protein, partial [Planctomycetaceae bacterium]|nr:DUF1501 domain-containing protein [Planctomycetaceae bacterium]